MDKQFRSQRRLEAGFLVELYKKDANYWHYSDYLTLFVVIGFGSDKSEDMIKIESKIRLKTALD